MNELLFGNHPLFPLVAVCLYLSVVGVGLYFTKRYKRNHPHRDVSDYTLCVLFWPMALWVFIQLLRFIIPMVLLVAVVHYVTKWVNS